MKRLIYGLIISICLFPNIVSGLECTNEDKTRLQKLADNVTYTLEDYEDNGNTYFKVTFSGVSKGIRIFSDRKQFYYRNYTNNEIGEFELKPLYAEKTYKFIVYGNDTCLYNKFRTITLNIPSVNVYFNDSACNGASEYKLCQKWTNNDDISYEEFVNRVTEYKNNKNNIEDKENISNNQNNKYFDFMDIYNKYYLPTFICMICLLIILIILWIRENKKNKL